MPTQPKIGLQIYGLRDELEKDYAATIAAVATLGVDGVELFGAHLPANETHDLLAQHHLEAIAYHFALPELEKDLNACIERSKTLGVPILVCAWSMPNETQSWQTILQSLKHIQQTVQNAGLQFAYHNHAHELEQALDGQSIQDHIAAFSNLEVDVAWVHASGEDAAAYVRENAAKTLLFHIKDVRPTDHNIWQTVEYGAGEVPLDAILEAAGTSAAPWWIVEQDDSATPLESTAHNVAWLRAWLAKNA